MKIIVTEQELNDIKLKEYNRGFKDGKSEQVRGVWLHKNNDVVWWHECSICGKKLLTSGPTRYCSDCGALMTQVEEHPEDGDQEFYD